MPAEIINNVTSIKYEDDLAVIKILLTDSDGTAYPLVGKDLIARFRSEKTFLMQKDITEIEDGYVILRITKEDSRNLYVGAVYIEIAVYDNGSTRIFPEKGFIEINIDANASVIVNNEVSVISLEYFQEKFTAKEQEIDTKYTEKEIEFTQKFSENQTEFEKKFNDTANEVKAIAVDAVVPDKGVTNPKLNLSGVEVPVTFDVGLDAHYGGGSTTRAFTYNSYPFKKGDKIKTLDSTKVHFALFNIPSGSYTAEWKNEYTMTEDKDLYLGMKKPDGTSLTQLEIATLKNLIILTNEKTVTNYETNVELIKKTTGIYDGVVRNDNVVLSGTDLPKTYSFVKKGTSNRLYTDTLNFKAGDILDVIDGVTTEFALFTPEDGTVLGWSSEPYTVTSDRSLYVALRKPDDSLFTNEDVAIYSRHFYMKNSQTVVSRAEANKILADQGVETPRTLLFERTGASNRIYSAKQTFTKGDIFTIDPANNLQFAVFKADNSTITSWSTSLYTVSETQDLYIAIRKSDDSVIALADIPALSKQFAVKTKKTIATYEDAAELIDASGIEKTLYVSPDGSDANDGTTKAKSLATFQKAIDLGATIIQAKRGVYRMQSAANYNTPIKVIPYEQDTYSADHVDRQKIVIDNGTFFTATASEGLYTFAFAGNDRFRQVFIDKTLPIDTGGSRPSYNAGMWQTHLDWQIDVKLKPVLTLAEVQAEPGTFTWDGTTVTVNPADTTIDPQGFTIHGDINNGFTFQHCPEVVLEDVVVKYSLSRNIRLLNCMNVTARNSGSMYTMFADGWQLDYTNGNFYNCFGHKSRNDGFNLHYFGDTHFFDCEGHYNDDDGISHHDGCTGSINNSHFTFNGKAGIAPTYGSIVNLFGNICTDNYFNYYCISDAVNPRRTVRHQGNISLRPGRSDITIRGYDILGYQNKYEKKELTADSSYTDLGA